VARGPHDLPPLALAFLAERHLATLTTLRPDGSPHVVPVAFTWDAGTAVARVIASRSTTKVRNASAGGPAVLCQVDGRRWLSLEGTGSVVEDGDAVADAEQRYAVRYRVPRANPARVVLLVTVTRVLGDSTVIGPATS
jgi:F420H(2)-dependent biliverdin reductase